MSCIASQGVVFCQFSPMGFAFGVWFLISIGILIREAVERIGNDE